MPQGSIFGPFLVLVDINDVANPNDRVSFACLQKILRSVYSTCSNLDDSNTNINNQFVHIEFIFISNKLTQNVDVTQLIILSRRKGPIPKTKGKLRGKPIVNVAKTEFLGLEMDERLNW